MHKNARRKLLFFFKFQALRALVDSGSQLGVTIRGTPAISHRSTLSTKDFLHLSRKQFFLFFKLAYKAYTQKSNVQYNQSLQSKLSFSFTFGILTTRFADLWIFLERTLFKFQKWKHNRKRVLVQFFSSDCNSMYRVFRAVHSTPLLYWSSMAWILAIKSSHWAPSQRTKKKIIDIKFEQTLWQYSMLRDFTACFNIYEAIFPHAQPLNRNDS